jgi:hypothetical protein
MEYFLITKRPYPNLTLPPPGLDGMKEHDNLVKTIHAEGKIRTRHFPETPQPESTLSVRK